eukprot:4649932-Pleurochrysis_carterae.AAC.2
MHVPHTELVWTLAVYAHDLRLNMCTRKDAVSACALASALHACEPGASVRRVRRGMRALI